jgi:hypothetical protein
MGKNLMKQHLRRQRLQEARSDAVDLCEAFLDREDVTALYTLHTMPEVKWGKKKLERYYLNLVNNHYEMAMQFKNSADDEETHYLVMADRLKRDGIDVAAIQAKAMAIKKPEYDYEERQRLIKEMLGNGNANT